MGVKNKKTFQGGGFGYYLEQHNITHSSIDFLAFVTKLICNKLLSHILLVLSNQMQSLSDYWAIDLIMTSLTMMISVTYSVDKNTANLCSLVASFARTTH